MGTAVVETFVAGKVLLWTMGHVSGSQPGWHLEVIERGMFLGLGCNASLVGQEVLQRHVSWADQEL